jgi:hypothetical protein
MSMTAAALGLEVMKGSKRSVVPQVSTAKQECP